MQQSLLADELKRRVAGVWYPLQLVVGADGTASPQLLIIRVDPVRCFIPVREVFHGGLVAPCPPRTGLSQQADKIEAYLSVEIRQLAPEPILLLLSAD